MAASKHRLLRSRFQVDLAVNRVLYSTRWLGIQRNASRFYTGLRVDRLLTEWSCRFMAESFGSGNQMICTPSSGFQL